MAEVVGIVTSGFAIAQASGLILKTIIKIKSLLQHLKDIAEDIHLLLEKIEKSSPQSSPQPTITAMARRVPAPSTTRSNQL